MMNCWTLKWLVGREDKEKQQKEAKSDFLSAYNQVRQELWNVQGPIAELLSNKNLVLKLCKQDPYGRTMLHYAAERGHSDMVKLLLAHGTNPNAQEKIGLTPIALAVVCGHINVVQILLELPVALSSDQYSCIQLAGKLGHDAIVSLLVDYEYHQEAEDDEMYALFPKYLQPCNLKTVSK